MGTPYRPILPAQSSGQAPEPVDASEKEKRRIAVLAACMTCQRAKTKCSGDRPVCYRCSTKNLPCEYDVEPNQTRASSRRETESQLRELYTYLQTRSWNEALEILRRIRETPDPLDVVRLVRAGDLLLHKTMPDERENTTMGPRFSDGQGPSDVQPLLFSPWTTITDYNTVQLLITEFFEKEQRFLMSFIDRDMFLNVMQAKPRRSSNGWFCSALLVNAICAIAARHCTSTTGVNFTSRRNLGNAFFTEAKGLLELEGGKSSLSTAQALLIMYSYSCRMGRDRIGNIFRASSYEMMDRMMPKMKRALLNTAHPVNSRRAISRAIWGIFCFDSICSSVYLRPSLFLTPDVPRPFSLLHELERFQSRPEAEESVQGPPGQEPEKMMLRYAYDLSEISSRALEHAGGLDGPDRTRSVSSHLPQLYHELRTLQYSFPVEEGYRGECLHEHCHLWAYYHLVALNIARLLQRSDSQLPSPLDRLTDVCVGHCQSIMKHVDRHLTRYPFERQSSISAIYFAYSCTITLVDLLAISPSAVQTFSRACQVFHEATEYPLSNLLLEGLVAIANQLCVQLPADSALYFSKLNVVGIEKENIPFGFVYPIRGRLFKPLNDGAWDFELDEVECELADISAHAQ